MSSWLKCSRWPLQCLNLPQAVDDPPQLVDHPPPEADRPQPEASLRQVEANRPCPTETRDTPDPQQGGVPHRLVLFPLLRLLRPRMRFP